MTPLLTLIFYQFPIKRKFTEERIYAEFTYKILTNVCKCDYFQCEGIRTDKCVFFFSPLVWHRLWETGDICETRQTGWGTSLPISHSPFDIYQTHRPLRDWCSTITPTQLQPLSNYLRQTLSINTLTNSLSEILGQPHNTSCLWRFSETYQTGCESNLSVWLR